MSSSRTGQQNMDLDALNAVATSIRLLAADAVEASGTGHPGMPMGFADVGATLFGEILKHNPARPDWIDRDRFVLSAGHGSVFLYALLHLTGYGLELNEIKRLRRLGSKTPGHPEFGLTTGVETTTGPLGAGFSTAVGMAMAERMLATRFNSAEHRIIDHHTYVIAGDGDLMEGVSAEAASLAGHHRLGKLIVLYDSNKVSIEGPTSITFTEDVEARFRAYGWQTLQGSAHDPQELMQLVDAARENRDQPTLITLESVIGYGSPGMAGKHKVHGAALGHDEIRAMRRHLGAPEDADFYVDPKAYTYFEKRRADWSASYDEWQRRFEAWRKANPALAEELADWLVSRPASAARVPEEDEAGRTVGGSAPRFLEAIQEPQYETGETVAIRSAGGDMLKAVMAALPNVVGGSADLSSSNKTEIAEHGVFQPESPEGKLIRYGVREHAMASITNGLALHGGIRPFAATLFVFIDYMRPPMRLAALMKLPVIYVLTHDSIYLGGDGPTHQAIEHLATLRVIPNFVTLRPADAEEVVAAWRIALERTDGPTAIVLARQGVPVLEKADPEWRRTMRRGAYIVHDCAGEPEVVIVATGSEVALADAAAREMADRKLRVVSMPSVETFLAQDREFRERIIPAKARVLAVETASPFGWERIGANREDILAIDTFGESGRPEEVGEHFGFTVENLIRMVGAQGDSG